MVYLLTVAGKGRDDMINYEWDCETATNYCGKSNTEYVDWLFESIRIQQLAICWPYCPEKPPVLPKGDGQGKG